MSYDKKNFYLHNTMLAVYTVTVRLSAVHHKLEIYWKHWTDQAGLLFGTENTLGLAYTLLQGN